MQNKRVDILMSFLLGFSVFTIMVGALLKLEHYPFGDLIFKGGFVASLILSGIEITRLKKVIAKMRKEREVLD